MSKTLSNRTLGQGVWPYLLSTTLKEQKISSNSLTSSQGGTDSRLWVCKALPAAEGVHLASQKDTYSMPCYCLSAMCLTFVLAQMAIFPFLPSSSLPGSCWVFSLPSPRGFSFKLSVKLIVFKPKEKKKGREGKKKEETSFRIRLLLGKGWRPEFKSLGPK